MLFHLILGMLVMTHPGQAAGHPATVRVAVCQILAIDGDREGNFRRIEYALADAQAKHAQIAAFPESVILGWENPGAHRMAAPIPGADSERIASLARKYGLMIAIGLDERDDEHLYDSAILVDKTGKLLWKHRKINVLPELMTPPYSEWGFRTMPISVPGHADHRFRVDGDHDSGMMPITRSGMIPIS